MSFLFVLFSGNKQPQKVGKCQEFQKLELRSDDDHGRRRGGAEGLGPPLEFEILAKKGSFLSFEW